MVKFTASGRKYRVARRVPRALVVARQRPCSPYGSVREITVHPNEPLATLPFGYLLPPVEMFPSPQSFSPTARLHLSLANW